MVTMVERCGRGNIRRQKMWLSIITLYRIWSNSNISSDVLIITSVHYFVASIIDNLIVSLLSIVVVPLVKALAFFVIKEWNFLFLLFQIFIGFDFLKSFHWNLFLVRTFFQNLSSLNFGFDGFLFWNFLIIQIQFIKIVLSEFLFHLSQNFLKAFCFF